MIKIVDDLLNWIVNLTEWERESLEKKDRRSDAVKPKKETEE